MRMTGEERKMIFELYKAHYTARELEKLFPFSYVTIQQLFRGFGAAGIKKYDRINLITKEDLHADAKLSEAVNS